MFVTLWSAPPGGLSAQGVPGQQVQGSLPPDVNPDSRNRLNLAVMARLAPGVSLRAAEDIVNGAVNPQRQGRYELSRVHDGSCEVHGPMQDPEGARDLAAQVTGIVLPVDGGTTAGPPMVKLDVLVAGDPVDALSIIVQTSTVLADYTEHIRVALFERQAILNDQYPLTWLQQVTGELKLDAFSDCKSG
jgi:hypothetical protein